MEYFREVHAVETTQTRAAKLAANIEANLKAVGQMPDSKPPKPQIERETPEQLARRRILKEKLRSFVD
jgi:hypothetical protein